MKRLLLLLAAIAVCSVAAPKTPAFAQGTPAYVTAAVNDASRPAADKMRDANRKPAESIVFAGVKPGDKVVDFLAGGGYFTRILSKVAGPQGHVYATAQAMPMGAMAGSNVPMGNMPGNNMPSNMPAAGGMPMGGMGGDGLRMIAGSPAYANVSELMQSPSKLIVPEPVDVGLDVAELSRFAQSRPPSCR